MSKKNGQEIFEIPSEEDLAEYIQKGKKVIQHMEEGKPPVFFKPKTQFSRLPSTAIMILVLIGSLIIVVPTMISVFSSVGPITSNNTSQTSTTSHQPTSTTQTTIPSGEKPITLSQSTYQLETFLGQFIPEDLANLAPFMINNTINVTKPISYLELLDLIWLLSQDEVSEWWNLGMELLFTEYRIWEDESVDTLPLDEQARTLRTLLSYPYTNMPLEGEELTSFNNKCTILWTSLINNLDNISNTIAFTENSSTRIAAEQIVFLDILNLAADYNDLFNHNELQGYTKNIIETLDSIITDLNGIPLDFLANLTHFNPIYSFKDQGHLFIVLHKLDKTFELGTSATNIIHRLDSFNWNYLTQVDWSCNAYYNYTSRKASSELLAYDQGLMIRNHVLMDRLSSANYTANTLIKKLSMQGGGFFSSNLDNSTAYLHDQMQILLAFKELIQLEEEHNTGYQPGAATFWGIQFIILVILGLSIRRLSHRKRKEY